MEWAALIAWVLTAGGGFVLLASWLSTAAWLSATREGSGRRTAAGVGD